MLKEDVNTEVLVFEEGDKSIVPEDWNHGYFRKLDYTNIETNGSIK